MGIIRISQRVRRGIAALNAILLIAGIAACSDDDPTAPIPPDPEPATRHIVPEEFSTIRAAMAVAVAGDTVFIRGGTYRESGLEVPAGVTLEGALGDTVVIDGSQDDDYGPVIRLRGGSTYSRATRLRNLTVRGGLHCAVYVESGEGMALTGCRIVDSYIGLQTYGNDEFSRLAIDDCEFTANGAFSVFGSDSEGSALCISGAFTVEVSNSAFSDHEGGRRGAVYVDARYAWILFSDCSFLRNRMPSFAGGGAIQVRQADYVYLNRCEFRENESVLGGAVAIDRTDYAVITGSVFRANRAGAGGALMASNTHPLEIRDSLFEGNLADQGGALHLTRGAFEVDRCFFIGNGAEEAEVGRSESVGGAIYAFYAFPVEISDSTFDGNWAYGTWEEPDGGACVFFRGPYGYLHLASSQVTFSPIGKPLGGGVEIVVLGRSNVYGNTAGDYTALIEPYQGMNENESTDPLYCDREQGDFNLRMDSPFVLYGDAYVGAGSAGCDR